MKLRHIVMVAAIALTISGRASAQQPQSAQQPAPPVADRPPTLTQQFRTTVALLRVRYKDGSTEKELDGTSFFVLMEDKRLGERKGWVYLVTNRHMAEPGIENGEQYPVQGVFLRLNLKNPPESSTLDTDTLPLGNQLPWFFPADDSVDLAVLPIAPDIGRYDYKSIPVSAFATLDEIRTLPIGPGDPVLFAGYFYQFPGQKRSEPIIRQGVIAMMPNEKLNTTLKKPGNVFLADVHAFHGNSGSPLLVNLGGIRGGGISLGEHYSLLGIVSGYYPEDEKYSVPAATVLTGEVHDNSGIAAIVPVEELSKLLNSPALKAFRDAHVPTETKRN